MTENEETSLEERTKLYKGIQRLQIVVGLALGAIGLLSVAVMHLSWMLERIQGNDMIVALANNAITPAGTIIVTALVVIMGAVALKTIIGFRFPWEKCICCGEKVRDH